MQKTIYSLFMAISPFFLFAQKSNEPKLPFGNAQAVATISNPLLEEVSGLAFSRKHPNLMYIHTDSGGEAAVYLMDSLGNELGKLELEGVENRDWEEIAVGPGPNGQSYVFVGEIGDNLAKHGEVIVYRFPEPNRIQSGKVAVEAAILTYPKGARDAETMMVDPLDGRIYILSKRDDKNSLYSFDQKAFEKAGETEMKDHFNLPFTMSTAGDISADGSKILIKNYQSIFYWEREEGEDLLDVLKRDPISLPYNPEPQGEAIGFGPSGATFYTLSEKRFSIAPVLYCYPSTR
jgi:Tol biopolymer transport system component